ncbi:hypothetical protein FIU87_07195 [Bacillus sp. THAF10]|uniref:hypothetical protein n=1 Tax=Bacillus sp. THAF10 TaxID=2587848 RepID=UPI00126978ED|nr:hypothetical protein [Bacillus sp. THAF10]QFT88424.1 hypothetical protein FIU87_07195 [Bacillus sp. THAF10]
MTRSIIDKRLNQFESLIPKTSPLKEPIIVCFGISFKSKKVCKNWEIVQKNLSNTLRSIFNNTKSNFLIVVAGHEKPKIAEIENEKVKWISSPFKPPISPKGFNLDKRKKRILIGAYLRTIHFNGYYMHLDADDLIHYKFIEYLNSLPLKKAFIIRESFMINTNIKEIWVTKRFYLHCGSSSVIYFNTNELPLSFKRDKSKFSKFAFTSHRLTHSKFKKNDYQFLDQPLVLRVFGYGDNNMTIKGLININVSSLQYRSKGVTYGDWIWNHFNV